MDIHRYAESADPMVEVTPWSKVPTRMYEPVDVEIIGAIEEQKALILLTKKNGFSMALGLNAEGVELLTRDLNDIRRRFRKEKP